MKKNALMAKVHESALTILSGEDLLSVYEWNTRRAKHFFCSRCGIYTFHLSPQARRTRPFRRECFLSR
jgi:hypothetical protein